jgi:spore maturation protein CgeB
MNILIIGKNISKTDTGDYINIVLPLIELKHKIRLFDLENDKVKNEINLNEIIGNSKPNLLFFIPVEDELCIDFITTLSKDFTTLAYFYDDTWRIEYSKKWANAVNYFVTSDPNWKLNFKEYESKVIFSSFFVNCKKYYNNSTIKKKYDISFVGQYHPYREWIINKLINSGFNVKVYGYGWALNSTINFTEMVEVFNDSKINLNLSNCINFDIRYILDFNNKNFFTSLKTLKLIYNYYFKKDMKIYEMVKARFFEINACGGFQMAFYAEGLETEYEIGKEIAIFNNIDELIRRVKYYLSNEEDRKNIARRAYEKTLYKHDSIIKLKNILSRINFI